MVAKIILGAGIDFIISMKNDLAAGSFGLDRLIYVANSLGSYNCV